MTLWYGILIGLFSGFVRWKVPGLLRTRHVRKLRQTVMDIKRIQAQFTSSRRMSNHFPLGWRERSIEKVLLWWELTKPQVVDHIRR